MTIALIIICSFNLLLSLFLAYKLIHLKKTFGQFKVEYFTDVTEKSGLVKKSKLVCVKSQLYVGSIPVGSPITVSETYEENIDKETVNKILNQLAKPLLSLGFRVATKKLL